MTAGKDKPTASGNVAGWVHFGIAVALLAGSTVAFEYKSHVEQWARQKESIPWPENVIVDPDTFCLKSFPDTLGDRYVLAEDGELGGRKDGLADGEIILADDVMDTLRIGTSWDEERLADRSSNWQMVRIYRDITRPVRHPLRLWRVEVYYYTGALDTVPHVPERCAVAGGATWIGSEDASITVPAAPSPWDKSINIRRAMFEMSDKVSGSAERFVQYYLFSLNGRPESSWVHVRRSLANPLVRYCYFAKMQFSPWYPSGMGYEAPEIAEVDKAAEELINYFLPAILRAIPMPSDIEALKASRPS